MFTLRGLPPDMEIPEIRSYIQERCAVGRVLLDELQTDAGGTRSVTVAPMSDADAATLRRVLSGKRLGAYTLRVEPCQSSDTYGINSVRDVNEPDGCNTMVDLQDGGTCDTYESLRDNCDLGGYNDRESNDHRRYGRRGLRGNSETHFSDSGRIGRSSGRDTDSRGVSNWRDCGNIGGLEGNNTLDGDGLSDFVTDTGRNYRGRRGFGRHSVQHHGKGSDGWGERNIGEDRIDGHGLKICRESSEGYAGHNSVSGVNFERRSKDIDVPYHSPGRGDFSDTDSSHGGGLVGYNGANSSQEGESRDFSGGSGISESNVMREYNPHPYAKRESRQKPPWVRMKEAIKPTFPEPSANADQMKKATHSTLTYPHSGVFQSKEVTQPTSPDMHPSWQSKAPWKWQRNQQQLQEQPTQLAPKRHMTPSRLRKSREKRAMMMKLQVTSPTSGPSEAAESDNLKEKLTREGDIQQSWSPVRKSPWQLDSGAQLLAENQQCEPPFEPPAPNTIPTKAEKIFNNTMPTITAPWATPKPIPPSMGPGAPRISFSMNPQHQFEPGLQQMQTQVEPPNHAMGTRPRFISFEPVAIQPQCNPTVEPVAIQLQFNPHVQPMDMQPQINRPVQPIDVEPPFNPPFQAMGMQPAFNPSVHPMGMQPQLNPPVEQMGLQPQFNPPVLPMGMQPKSKSPIEHIESWDLNSIESKKKDLKTENYALSNPQFIQGQTFSKKPSRYSRQRYISFDLTATSEKEMSPIEKRTSDIYTHDSSNIVNSMVDCTKINEKNKDAVSFVWVLRHIIGKRLRELTNGDPFDKDLVSIYRKAYPPLTDEEAMKSACKQLSLPGIPMQPKVLPFLHKIQWNTRAFDHIVEAGDVAAVDLTKYVNTKIKMDTNYNKSTEENVRRDRFRVKSAGYIANRLLDPSNKECPKPWGPEEVRLRPYFKNVILKEFAKLPQREFHASQDLYVIFRLYHESTRPERNRHLIEEAIENCNATEGVPYRGIFTKPDKAAIVMESWPDLYLKPDEVPPTPANMTESKVKIQMVHRTYFATAVIASEVFLRHRTEYQKYEAELNTESVQKPLRYRLEERMNDLVPTDVTQVVSTCSLVSLYRRAYPQETDEELVRGVIKEQLEKLAIEDGTYLKRPAVLKWLAKAAIVLSNETVYGQGRVLSDAERKGLTQPQSELLSAVRIVVRDRIERTLSVRVQSPEQMCALYRRRFPADADAAFVLAVVRRGERDLDTVLAEETEPEHQNSTDEKQGEVSSRTMGEWCHSLACEFADVALHGRSLSRNQKDLLSKDSVEKMKLAREIVRGQLEEIVAGKHGAVSSRHDLQRLYRKHHPPGADAALKERVVRMAATNRWELKKKGDKKPDESKVAGWRDAVIAKVADEALFGRPLSGLQRKALTRDEQEKIQIAREMVRAQFEKILARKHQPPRRFSDVLRLYRWRHRLSEDAVLKARVMRKMDEHKATARESTSQPLAEWHQC